MSTCANELNDASWFKSSYSDNQGGACLEAARLPNRTLAVRDSKAPDGPVLTVAPAAWGGFITTLASRTPPGLHARTGISELRHGQAVTTSLRA